MKRFGVSIDPSLYIQDMSMLHIKGWNITSDVDTSVQDVNYAGATLPINAPDFMSSLSNPSSFSISGLMG